MRFAHLVSAFFLQPWHMRRDKYIAFGQILARHYRGDAIDGVVFSRPAQSLEPQFFPVVGPADADGPIIPQMRAVGPVAVIPVYGPLGSRLSMLDLVCGGCDYGHVREMIHIAAHDQRITSVVFDIDSPGGSHAGVAETAQAIADLTAEKPTYAFAGGDMASAAYWLGARCMEVLAAPSAVVGSIGTVMAIVDDSRRWEAEGLKLELFASSEFKAAGHDGTSLTDAQRDYFRERLGQADAAFKTAARSARPGLTADAMSGKWFWASATQGPSGLTEGLIDGVAPSLDDLLQAVLLSA